MNKGVAVPADYEQPDLHAAVLATSRSILSAQQRAERDLLAAREALQRQNEALAAVNSILEATLDATPVGVLVIGRDGLVSLHNRRFDRLLGLPGSIGRALDVDAVATVVRGRLAHPEEFTQWFREVQRAPDREHDLQCQTVEGLHLQCHALPHRVGERTVGVVCNWLDVTESVQAEAMRHRVLAAESATRAQASFMSRASHELRTPLNAVLGFSQLLQGHPKVKGDAQVSRQVDHIRTAGEHLLALMDDLLHISQLDAGSMKLHVEPLDLGAVLLDTLALMQPQARLRGIVLLEPSSACAWVLGDVTRVRQVLMNLLSNAIKYNVTGGLVRLTLAEQAGRWSLDIADDGPGFTAEQTRHLFEPFNRLGAERTGVEGTGLGLVIARQLMAAMNGTIALRSTSGVGTVFTLAWPRAAALAA